MLDEKTANQTSKWIEDNVTVPNCIPYLFFSQLFRLQETFKTSLRVIERWFTTIADSDDFLELDFKSVAAILNSSELLIDSELQVFNAMNAWLNHKSIGRCKHAKYLLQRVRLSLLTVPALNNILDKNLWIVMNHECSEIIKKVIMYKTKHPRNSTNDLPTSRYCNQWDFNFVIAAANRKVVRDYFIIDSTDFSRTNTFPIKNIGKDLSKIVFIKGEIYVIGSSVYNKYDQVIPIEKYSPSTNTWDIIGEVNGYRVNFCACSFVDHVYVIGGYLFDGNSSCVKFCTINKKWKQIAKINVTRQLASCAVFEGRIVVSGGISDGNMKTVEAYDHVDDSWKYMPSMIERRDFHKSVAIKNKLFLVGGSTFDSCIEVFDSLCNRFVLIENPKGLNKYIADISDVVSVGNKIFIFSNKEGCVLIYDVQVNKWSRKSCEATKTIEQFLCSALPK